MQQTTTSHIKAQRLRLGLTLRTLADRCAEEGVTVGFDALGRIERQQVSPHLPLRDVLIKILDVSVEDFPPHNCRLVTCSDEYRAQEAS